MKDGRLGKHSHPRFLVMNRERRKRGETAQAWMLELKCFAGESTHVFCLPLSYFPAAACSRRLQAPHKGGLGAKARTGGHCSH
jgi:hypothetical protein